MRNIALMVLFLCCAASSLAAADRIVDRVDSNHTVAVAGHVHPAAIARFDQGDVDQSLPIRYATILMKPAPGLEQFLASQRDPSSPDYKKWLTPEQFATRFGLSDSDMNKVVAWLRSQGLQIHDVARGRLWVTFSGSAGGVGRAFRTRIRRYRVPTSQGEESHFANATDPSVPKAFETVVAGFEGLTDFQPRPHHIRAPASIQAPQYNSGSTTHYLAPDDLATIYNLKALYAAGIDGTGQKIAVIGRTNINLADIRAFRTRFKLPDNDPQVMLTGPDPGTSGPELEEANLDIQWAGAVARNATIIYVNSRSVITSAQYAIDQNVAPVMTYSYGACERSSSLTLRYLAQQANAQGITWIASSGDAGAAACDFTSPVPQTSKGPALSYPASIPEVTAVGGTTFSEGGGRYWASANDANGASALGYIPETAWNDSVLANDFIATGGGASAYFPKPPWQTGPGVPDDGARDIPDISLSASAAHDAYLTINSGALTPIGGTSAGAPAFAGVVALLNQFLVSQREGSQPGLGNINPVLYRMAQSTPAAFHDIVDGDNRVPCSQSSPRCVDGLTGFTTGPGYDLVTGLGSIDANELITRWDNGAASQTTVTATPSSTQLDGTVQLTATVGGKGSVAPTGTVAFLENDNLLGTAALKAAGDAAAATLQVAAVRLFGGNANGAITALYDGDGIYTSSAATVAVGLTLPGGGSLVAPSISPNPVYQFGGSWSYTITLAEKNGVATKLTGFTVDGVNNSANIAAFGNGNIPAGGSVSGLLGANLTAPRDRVFVFSGADADGREWKTQITVAFAGPVGPPLFPRIVLTSSPRTGVQPNPQADASCRWAQQLTVHEVNGYQVQLTALTAGTAPADNLSSQIQKIFGTARLAPFGSLRGTLCFDTLTPGSKTLTINGSAENGGSVTASVAVLYGAALSATGQFEGTAPAVSFGVPDSQHDASGTVALGFSSGTGAWTLSVTPDNVTTNWLTVSPLSGTGPATLTLRASAAGLSNGAYQATVVVESPTAFPQYLNIPVTLVVGASDTTKIANAVNRASGQSVYAPGMLATVTGSGLSPVSQQSRLSPLPLKLAGVSATVNGVSAPLSSVAPDEVRLQIPYEVGSGRAVLAINNNGQIASMAIDVAASAPGVFELSDSRGLAVTGAQQGQPLVVRITGEGDVTPVIATGASPASGTSTARLPAPRLPVVVTVGGVIATVDFARIRAGSTGITEIDFKVPADAPLGSQPVVISVGGVPSQPVMLDVAAAQ